MEKYVLVLFGLAAVFFLCLGTIFASAYIIQTEQSSSGQIVGLHSTDQMWNLGFRSIQDIASCRAYARLMNPETVMQCYGFQQLN